MNTTCKNFRDLWIAISINLYIPGNIFTDHMYRWGRYQVDSSGLYMFSIGLSETKCLRLQPPPPPLSRNQNPDMWNLGWQQCVNWISKYTVNILNNTLFLFQIWPELGGSDSTPFVSWYLRKTADNFKKHLIPLRNNWYLFEGANTSQKQLVTR